MKPEEVAASKYLCGNEAIEDVYVRLAKAFDTLEPTDKLTRELVVRLTAEGRHHCDRVNSNKGAVVTGSSWELEYIAGQLFGEHPTSIYLEFAPGNATCYSLLLAPVGRIPQLCGDASIHADEILVTWVGRSKSYIFSEFTLNPGYLADKLSLDAADAEQLSSFLTGIYSFLPPRTPTTTKALPYERCSDG